MTDEPIGKTESLLHWARRVAPTEAAPRTAGQWCEWCAAPVDPETGEYLAAQSADGLRAAAKRAVGEYFEWEEYQHGKPEYIREAMRDLERALSAEPPATAQDMEAVRVENGWPTPNSMRKAADGLDRLSIPRYGDILRWVAYTCDHPAAAYATPDTSASSDAEASDE